MVNVADDFFNSINRPDPWNAIPWRGCCRDWRAASRERSDEAVNQVARILWISWSPIQSSAASHPPQISWPLAKPSRLR